LFDVLKYVLILWGVIALGWLGAWWLKRLRGDVTSGQFTNIVLFVGFIFGFLLTTLQVLRSNHYSDARNQAQFEPTALVAMFDDLDAFPPDVSATARHDLICYMRSVVQQDWKAQEQGRTQEAPDTVARGDRLRRLRYTLPQDSPAEQVAYQQVSQALTDAGTVRQKLLFDAQPQVPTIPWVLVFVSSTVLFFLLVSDSQSQPPIVRRTVLAAVAVLMTAEVFSLAAIDYPFSPVARVEDNAMTEALVLLEAGRHGDPTFQDCGPLATASRSVSSPGFIATGVRNPIASFDSQPRVFGWRDLTAISSTSR
jgi:Protein of unknown function (DUF4239)